MNYAEFNDYIDTLVSDYDREAYDYFGDYCHEAADSSQYVIYNGMAWDLVNMIRIADYDLFNDAEIALEGMEFKTLQENITAMAYEIIYQQLSLAIQEKGV